VLIDSHAHLEMPEFSSDRDAVIERAKQHNVLRILTVGTDLELSRNAVMIARQTPQISASVAIHPHEAEQANDETLSVLESLAATPNVVAWGEIGLDFYKDYCPREIQRKALLKQLDLSRRLGLPVILHVRNSHEEVLEILHSYGDQAPGGVFHCFSGNKKQADQALALGFSLSFPGAITFKKQMDIHDVMAMTPSDRMLLETDCPYLTPVPYRGKRNEPSFIEFIYKAASAILNRPQEELETSCAEAFAKTFRLNPKTLMPPIFAYPIRDNLYFNITNRCTNNCTFCLGRPGLRLGEFDLELPYEPSSAEVLRQAGPDLSKYTEVVFCGLGEPTLRLEALKEIAIGAKRRGAKRVRLDTDGQANLIHGRDVTLELSGVIDSISVSLNAADSATYARLCRPTYGEKAYDSLIDFIRKAATSIPDTIVSAVALPGLDLEPIRNLAASLGVRLKVRSYHSRAKAS